MARAKLALLSRGRDAGCHLRACRSSSGQAVSRRVASICRGKLDRIDRTEFEEPRPKVPTDTSCPRTNPEGIEVALGLPDSFVKPLLPQAKAFGRKNPPGKPAGQSTHAYSSTFFGDCQALDAMLAGKMWKKTAT